MQILDRLMVLASFGGIHIGYQYMPKTHISTALTHSHHYEMTHTSDISFDLTK